MDAHKNFAVSTVATAPSPATSGTSLVVGSGHGTRFPAVPFNATIWPSTGAADPSNAEIVRVTAISTDTFTITRAQESTSARTVIVGDRIAATITAKTLNDGDINDDPIYFMLGTPNTAYEFDTTSLSGLTALGTPDAEDANTTIPSCYTIRDDSSGQNLVGRYVSAPSAPWTAITKLTAGNWSADQHKAMLFITEPSPGDLEMYGIARGNRRWLAERWTSPTSFAATILDVDLGRDIPVWLALRCNSATSVDFAVSSSGFLWRVAVSARNPTTLSSIANIGIGISPENTNSFTAAFDFLRIWNSALTLPGIP